MYDTLIIIKIVTNYDDTKNARYSSFVSFSLCVKYPQDFSLIDCLSDKGHL